MKKLAKEILVLNKLDELSSFNQVRVSRRAKKIFESVLRVASKRRPSMLYFKYFLRRKWDAWPHIPKIMEKDIERALNPKTRKPTFSDYITIKEKKRRFGLSKTYQGRKRFGNYQITKTKLTPCWEVGVKYYSLKHVDMSPKNVVILNDVKDSITGLTY